MNFQDCADDRNRGEELGAVRYYVAYCAGVDAKELRIGEVSGTYSVYFHPSAGRISVSPGNIWVRGVLTGKGISSREFKYFEKGFIGLDKRPWFLFLFPARRRAYEAGARVAQEEALIKELEGLEKCLRELKPRAVNITIPK